MEFYRDEEPYQRYIRGRETFAQFFNTTAWRWGSHRTAGFCEIMRVTYFWRPLIAFLRVLMMTLSVVFPVAVIIADAGAVGVGFAGLAIMCFVIVAVATLCMMGGEWLDESKADRRARKQARAKRKEGHAFFLWTWVKSAYRKICPIVEFKETRSEESN